MIYYFYITIFLFFIFFIFTLVVQQQYSRQIEREKRERREKYKRERERPGERYILYRQVSLTYIGLGEREIKSKNTKQTIQAKINIVLPAYPGAYAHERERRENQGESISSLTYCGAAHGREKAKKRQRERKSGHLPKRKGVECAYEQVGYMVDNHLSNTAHFPKHLYPCTPPALPDLALSRHLYTGQTNTLACACAYSIIEECS